MRAHLEDVNLFFGGAPSFPISDFGMDRTNPKQTIGHVLTNSGRKDRKSIGAPSKNVLHSALLNIGADVYSS